MSRLAARLAAAVLTAAARLLPGRLSPWAAAMQRELVEIEEDRAAVAFAAGCVRAVLGLAIADRLRSARLTIRAVLPSSNALWRLPAMKDLFARPRPLGLLCASFAVGVGIAYMQIAGAPPRFLLVNLAALMLGATTWLALGRAASAAELSAGPAIAVLAVALLLTALTGISVDGAVRWVSVGGLSLQVSLVVVPVMLVLYANKADAIGTAGMAVAALALALQPDRAMAGVMTAGLLAHTVARPGRLPILATAASLLAFAYSLTIADMVPAVPFVDRILYTSFDVHPLAGSAVVIGTVALVLPALAGALHGASERPALLAFGACWLTIVVAAALGNSPTPLVGYGGSAVLGYLLSVALLPRDARQVDRRDAARSRPVTESSADQTTSELCGPLPA